MESRDRRVLSEAESRRRRKGDGQSETNAGATYLVPATTTVSSKEPLIWRVFLVLATETALPGCAGRFSAGARLEKIPDETTMPTSIASWSAADWRAFCSGDQGLPSQTGGNARDLEMHRTKKGNQWHFEMKLRIGTAPPPGGGCTTWRERPPTSRPDAGYRGIGKRAVGPERVRCFRASQT